MKLTLPKFEERDALLTERRNLKMARSAHAYVRGNTLKFYEWLESASGRSLPQGPPIWICGDCHIGNLGPIANADGKIAIQIRDLDQTVIGNPAHDLIRLALSLATAARGSDLPGVMTARMLEQMKDGYIQALDEEDKSKKSYIEWPDSVSIAMEEAIKRKWKHLAKERIEDTKPTIPLGKKFWPLTKQERKEIDRLFGEEDVRKLVTSLRTRDDDASVEVLDAAYWMKGCSSLGNLRFAALIDIEGEGSDLCLMDVKEAITAAAPRYPNVKMPRSNAERIVTGAKNLSPHLGERMLAANFLDHSVFMRELLPQDLKLEIDHLTSDEAIKAARFLAMVVGKAHARQMDEAQRRQWKNELNSDTSKKLDAPSWLWSSVVELIVTHEAAYLEHCRKYAMSKA